MKRLFIGAGAGLLAVAGGFSVVAARHQETIRPNVQVGPVAVGGLTTDEAAYKVRVWWESEKLKTLNLKLPGSSVKLPALKPSELGVTLDDKASVAQLPLQGFLENAQAALTREPFEPQVFKPVLKPNGQVPARLFQIVQEAVGTPRPARVVYRDGQIVRKPESTGQRLDSEALLPAVVSAFETGGEVVLPLTGAPKRVPDEMLEKIDSVITEFSTSFSAGNRPRSSNIKLAASKIDGLVLAPGESFSFNETVGQRTLRAGFKVAGVYVNGRHDTGVGGGICQVSTTLYNAALLSDLKILKRSNHSMPVPYVPVGRDATVNWGTHDLIIENNYDFPIALSSTYTPGRLTFRILGQKVPGLHVKIERSGLRSWSAGTKTIVDPRLAPGRRRVIETGSSGYSVATYRVVYKDGKLVRRERLGQSHYPGGARIVAVGPARPKPAPVTPPPAMDGVETIPVSDPPLDQSI